MRGCFVCTVLIRDACTGATTGTTCCILANAVGMAGDAPALTTRVWLSLVCMLVCVRVWMSCEPSLLPIACDVFDMPPRDT